MALEPETVKQSKFSLYVIPAVLPAADASSWLRPAVIWLQALFAAVFAAGLIFNIHSLTTVFRPLSDQIIHDPQTYSQYQSLTAKVIDFERRQTQLGAAVAPAAELDQALAAIQVDIQIGHRKQALSRMALMEQKLSGYHSKLAEYPLVTVQGAGAEVPILLYHQPPSDFAYQLQLLQDRGYTTISLDQLYAAFTEDAALPHKPVIITFDDGFASQDSAIAELENRQMKATFYIINGGEASHYCIGAGRQGGNCGDAYLSWDRVRQLDRNPLFTIASHSADHLELAKQPAEIQAYQILEGKKQLEQQLGHPVNHFCYPYGSFNQTTLDLVRSAGFQTSTTTVPGTYQSRDSLLTLKRIRAAYDLP
jgi:peptidoglycan/xylan/chitin deacetylase (PgdA/CDA1 family)